MQPQRLCQIVQGYADPHDATLDAFEVYYYEFTPQTNVTLKIVLHVEEATGWKLTVTMDPPEFSGVAVLVGLLLAGGFIVYLMFFFRWHERTKTPTSSPTEARYKKRSKK